VGCNIWYSKEGTWRGRSPPRPLFAVPNLTAHPSTASVPITALLYNGPLLCGFNVFYKGLRVRYAMLAYVGLSVVRPFHCHISKTKQARLKLLRNTIQKLTALIMLPHSDPSRRARADIPVSNKKNGLLFDFGIVSQLSLTECDRRNLLFTIIVRCVDNICGMTPNSNRRRASFLSPWRYCS